MNSIIKKSLNILIILSLMILIYGMNAVVTVNAVAKQCTLEYGYADLIDKVSGSFEDKSNYVKIPAATSNTGTLTLSGIIENVPTSDIKITFNLATFGSGANPSDGSIVASGLEEDSTWTSSELSKYPTSSSYVSCEMTLHKSAAPTTISGLEFVFDTGTGKLYRLKSIKVEYDYEDTEAGLTISDSVENLMIGENKTFVATISNMVSPGTPTWTSSNTAVATVNETTGVVTAISMGTTIITSSVTYGGNLYSDTKTLKVYPNNANPITIKEALDICAFTGTTNTPYIYSTIATVKTAASPSLVITDGTDDIIVYKYDNGKEVGDKIKVFGNLVNYNATTPEFSGTITINDIYTVTFDANGGSAVETQEIEEGEKVAPIVTTKSGYTFLGWYNGVELWDLANDVVNSNITLKAKWLNDSLSTLPSDLATIKAYMSLGYRYSTSVGEKGYYKVSNTSNLAVGDKIVIVASEYDYAMSTTQNTNNRGQEEIQKSNERITFGESNTVQIFTLCAGTKVGTWALFDGNGYLYAASSSSNHLKTEDELSDNSSWTISISSEGVTTLVSNGSNTRNTIQYNKTSLLFSCYAGETQAAISIYKETDSTVFTDADFRIYCGIDKNISDIQTELDDAIYGIEVSDGTTPKKYASTNPLYQTEVDDDGKAYVIIKLGDVLTNRERLDITFTVRAYVEYDGETYYSSSTKEYTLVSLLQGYINLNDDEINAQIAGLKAILESFGKKFE